MLESNHNISRSGDQPALPTEPDKVFSITWKNLAGIQPDWLGNENILYLLKLFVLDVSESGDPVDAANAFNVLHELLGKNPSLAEEEPILFKEYLRTLAVLKASFLITMPDEDIHNFLKTELLLALEVEDFEVRDKIGEIFSLYRGYPDALTNIAQELLRPIQENQEFLGTEPLFIPGKEGTQLPRASNWIIDYIQFTLSRAKSFPSSSQFGSVERATYLAQSPNVQKLSEDGKIILRRLLEIYDWLRGYIQQKRPESIYRGKKGLGMVQRIAVPPLAPQAEKQKPRAPLPPPPTPVRRPETETRIPDTGDRGPTSEFRPPTSDLRTPPTPKPKIDESLYRSTLEELRKMREEARRPAPTPTPMPTPASTPTPKIPLPPAEPFSVNEAVARGQIPRDHGELVRGEEIDKKLESLKEKIKRQNQSEGKKDAH